ncbi:hypothetical protein IPP75_04295 [Candidatus Saccharibacteria bacterium]|nr:MAG: hypothetical protein IPP75_04295 [Candidatus Saccharibacteria bacterium]
MSKKKRTASLLGLLLVVCAFVLLPTVRTYAAVSPSSYPEDKAKAFYYGSWLINCFSNGKYSIDMSGDASVNAMNVGPGDSFVTGLTGADPRKCNDKSFALDAIRHLNIPWATPQDTLNFLCDIGAKRVNDGECKSLRNDSQLGLDANAETGEKVRAIINSSAGYDVFAAYSNSKLLQYIYYVNLAFLKQCNAGENNTSLVLAEDITDIEVLRSDGTFETQRRQYNTGLYVAFDDEFNGHWNSDDKPSKTCPKIVAAANELAKNPAVAQEWKSSYMPGTGDRPGTCEDRYAGSTDALKACQDGFANKTNATYCSGAYPKIASRPDSFTNNEACLWGQSDKAIGATGITPTQNPTGSTNNSGAGDAPTSLCGFDGDSMEWIVCPVAAALESFSKSLASNIEGLMFFPTQDVFGKTGAGGATDNLRTAWASFRNIAIAIIVIAGLAMVISQALGFEILDAYTIRKLLPRLGVALVGIALSWNLMQFFIELTNDLGSWTHDLVVGPFANMPVAKIDTTNTVYNWATVLVAIVVGIPKLYFLGGVGVITLLLIVGLIIFLAFMLFGLRWVVIMLCLLLAPLAIASYVLPGTQKVWAFWKNTTITSLAIFPVIMGLLASGEAMARVTSQIENLPGGYILVVVIFVGPIVLIIPIAQKFGGVLGGAIGWASGLGSKAMGKGNKFLHENSEYRKGEYATGAKRGPALVTGYARRSALSRQGGFSLTRSGRRQYRQAEKKLIQDAAAERAEKDKGFSLGATDATIPAIYANSRGDYLREYVNRNRAAMTAEGLSENQMQQRARMRMGQLEAGTGTVMGSRAMKAAAFRGQTMDGAGWFNEATHETDFQAIAEASNHLIKQGIMSDEDIGGVLGQNQARADFSGMTFSQRVGIATMGERGNGALTDEQQNLLRSQSYQSMRNSQAELGNLRTARKVAREGGMRLNATLTDNMAGFESGGNRLLTGTNDMDTLASEFATFANFQDMASSASIDAREQFATQLKQQYYAEELSDGMRTILQPLLTARGGTVSTQEIMDYCRGNSDVAASQELIDLFTARRREYSSGRMRDAAGRAAMVDAPAA